MGTSLPNDEVKEVAVTPDLMQQETLVQQGLGL